MRDLSVLISGSGVAGPALAHALLSFGFCPTLVEREREAQRPSGVVDVWGTGYDALERMGLLERVLQLGEAKQERHIVVERNALSALLHEVIRRPGCELIRGDSLTGLDDDDTGVIAHFERAAPRRFDIVVGADGLRSNVRRLVFGDDSSFEFQLGFSTAVVQLREGAHEAAVYVEPGRQLAIIPNTEGPSIARMIFADEDLSKLPLEDAQAQATYVRECLSGMQGSEAVITAIEQGAPIYLERVSQIRMPHWFHPRVALLGDAAYAPSQLTGQGASLALAGAYVLAGELARASMPAYAFAAYDGQLRPLTEDMQREIEAWRHVLAPKSYFGMLARSLVRVPAFEKLFLDREEKNRIELVNYQLDRWPPEAETHLRTAPAHAADNTEAEVRREF